jgi:hypothetical protein
MKQIIRHIGFLSILLGLFILNGCVVTGTFVIDFHVSSTDLDDEGEFIHFAVDLTEEDDWNDHKDKIKYIDNIGFQLWLTNGSDEPMSATFYIDDYVDSAPYGDSLEVKANADLILTGLSAPADSKVYIDWPTSLSMVRNIDIIRTYAESGKFSVYSLNTSSSINYTLDSANVIVTFTAGY